jgi:hypothetical protein
MTNTQGVRISGAISGAGVVPANSYAIVQYDAIPNFPPNNSGNIFYPVTRYFGAGQSIPATLTIRVDNGSGSGLPITFNLVSGVQFTNT